MFPIVIDINYEIVCGHTRKKACERLGIKNVPCIKIDDLSSEQVRYFRLVDNRTSEYASWDFTRLEEELKLIDLDVVENYLLLETFELDSELIDLNAEVTDIKVEAFNFLTPKQSSNPTNGSRKDSGENYDDEDGDKFPRVAKALGNSETITPPMENIAINTHDNKSTPSPTALIFEIGKIRFFISKVELDMLNSVYSQYMDSVYPTMSFVDYLLEGRVAND